MDPTGTTHDEANTPVPVGTVVQQEEQVAGQGANPHEEGQRERPRSSPKSHGSSSNDIVIEMLDRRKAFLKAPSGFATSLKNMIVGGSGKHPHPKGRRLSVIHHDGTVIDLNLLPTELALVLNEYDEDGNGILEGAELHQAASHLQKMRYMVKEGMIPISVFPEEDRVALKEFGDGKDHDSLKAHEILLGFNALKAERKRSRRYCQIACAATLFSAVLLMAMGILLSVVLERSKDAVVYEGKMVVKGTLDTVRVGNSDITVENGVLVARSGGDGNCQTGKCAALQVGQALQRSALTSEVGDVSLEELRAVQLRQGEAMLHLTVTGISRVPEPTSRLGTVVIIYTLAGDITLDADDVFVLERREDTFSRAGFAWDSDSDSMQHRLVGPVFITGSFNQ
mmetsp:Transcript_52296/g.106593  ORF Transcript_52296/g.106593 Transcript_52296/m.106593 type:complete len:396 (-) Transcript_52296:259-1446(-)